MRPELGNGNGVGGKGQAGRKAERQCGNEAGDQTSRIHQLSSLDDRRFRARQAANCPKRKGIAKPAK